MGFMDFMFGGPSTVDVNDDRIKGIAGQLAGFDPGLGGAGSYAKHFFKHLGRGEDMANFSPGVQLAISQGQRNWTDLQRQLQMSTAMMPGEQQGLSAGLMQTGMLKNQDNTGHNAIAAAAGDISNFANILNLARGQRMNAELQGLTSAGNLLQGGKRIVQKTGLIQGLSQIAGLVGGVMTGIPGLGGSGGGGGGANSGGGWHPGHA